MKLELTLPNTLPLPSPHAHMHILVHVSANYTGCGVNINNQYPTMSVNDCITLYNSSTSGSSRTSCHLPPLSEEQVLAHTLNSLELFLDTYQKTEMDELEQLYYKYWLHRYL